ncbi:unnamed protein product [marine sediment metagenome]|uniref:Uncharacterized protein n=1 Tax=marine sediment metagenome TaxID=412755 RepID=X0YTB0_9ZZZZ
MGMFDSIKYEMKCPKCGHKINSFQSKDGCCQLYNLNYWEVDNFYALCENCKTWVEFNRKNPRVEAPISDYEMTVREN